MKMFPKCGKRFRYEFNYFLRKTMFGVCLTFTIIIIGGKFRTVLYEAICTELIAVLVAVLYAIRWSRITEDVK